MEISGTRFGKLEYDDQETLHFKDGLLGFPLSQRFILFPYAEESPFFWLQSLDEPQIAFIVINPFDFFQELEFSIADEDAHGLGLITHDDAEIFTLVTIPEGKPEEMRTNLAGPLLVNADNRQGKQVLMKHYSPRQPLIPEILRGDFRQEIQKKLSTR
ncbi:MAG: flagellar assembly protein FliW [Magnetococcales bacterium]|nr:flagellar assembly protein FliW [Magnetococcales bacterium]